MLKKLKSREKEDRTPMHHALSASLVFLDSFLVLVRCPGLGKRNGKRPPLLPGGNRKQETGNKKHPVFFFFLGRRSGKWPSRDLGLTSFVYSSIHLDGYLESLGCVFQLASWFGLVRSGRPLFPRSPGPQDSRTPPQNAMEIPELTRGKP